MSPAGSSQWLSRTTPRTQVTLTENDGVDARHRRDVHPAIVVFPQAGGAGLPVGKPLVLAGAADEES